MLHSVHPYRNNPPDTSFMKSMKKIALFLLVICFAACNNKSKAPDVSNIKVDLVFERFEPVFFAIDSNRIAEGLTKVHDQFRSFYPEFMQNILGVSGSESDTATLSATKMLLRYYTLLSCRRNIKIRVRLKMI
jgi:hypothetical protein